MKFTILGTLVFSLAITNGLTAQERKPSTLTSLAESLNIWLDTQSEYHRHPIAPKIQIVTADHASHLHGVADRSGDDLRGLYDETTETIYLVEPWDQNNPQDVSILLHELVHHRQATKHWYCPQAQEWRAYQIQAQWLQENNLQDDFYWPAIVLKSSCAKRDIHPDQ